MSKNKPKIGALIKISHLGSKYSDYKMANYTHFVNFSLSQQKWDYLEEGTIGLVLELNIVPWYDKREEQEYCVCLINGQKYIVQQYMISNENE